MPRAAGQGWLDGADLDAARLPPDQGVSAIPGPVSLVWWQSNGHANAVDYGTTVDFGLGTCAVCEQGVRCTNSDGHGFTVAKAAHTKF